MNWNFLKEIGKLETFEIKNSSKVLFLAGPGFFLYSIATHQLNPNLKQIVFAREFFTVLFLSIALLPLTKNKIILNYYGIITFIAASIFEYYLVYMMALNNFSLDFLLGAYIVTFGAVLMFSNRWLIILFSTFQLFHMTFRVSANDIDVATEGAILISITTIFIFSFIILNGAMQYRRGLEEMNIQLESKIKQRTLDLENRAKELYERNKDLKEFAYVVSHDLKRPLHNIHTIAEWITSKDFLQVNDIIEDSEMYKNLFIIKEQVVQMDMLINGILNYSLQMEKEKEIKKIDVDSLVRRLIMVNSSDTCKIEIVKPLPHVYFNESQLFQVFQNLIQNAIKHNDKEIVHIQVDVEDNFKDYVFSISDNGPGIDQKYHQKIFQLFQKLELQSDVDSIGIGLALVKKIIERNDGKVWLESKKGEGTTFFFIVAKC